MESRLAVTIIEGAIAAAKAEVGIAASRRNSARVDLGSDALVRVLSPRCKSSIVRVRKIINPSARAVTNFLVGERRR
jgi:hypothetical protein